MAKGISLIQGNKYPKIGEATTYTVAGYYPGTIPPQDESAIKWKIYAELSTGNWRELRGSERQGRQATFSFPQQWYGKKILIEAYLHNPEIKAPPGLIIMPVPGERTIDSIIFFDSNGNPLQQTPKYGQTLKVRINTVNMLGEDLKISLWERDTYSDTGHDPTENTNVWDSEKTYTVTDPNGRVEFSMSLDLMWRLKADKGIFDIEGSEHEYYLLVKGAGARTKFSRQQNVRDEVDSSPNSGTQSPSTQAPARNPPAAASSNPAAPTPTGNNTPASAPANVSQQEPVTVGGVGANPPAPSNAVSPATVNDVTIEGLTDAYFEKKEYTKKTTDSAGDFVYTILKNNNRTATDAQKTTIATAILGKPNVQDLVKEKRYTTIDAIKAGLTQEVYNENDTVTFETFKLEAEFVKVNSAPLESKLYLVAKAFVLNDKQATIIVKEKDGLIKGSPDAVLPILEITEEEMEQTATSGTVLGTEKLEFTGTIKDGMVKIPIHLRPKTEDDLKIWKDKLAKGIEDGTYTYKFVTANNINDEATRKRIAGIILNNIKTDTPTNKKIEDGKTAYQADIEASLELINYAEGAEISFPIYKKQPELLYLNVKATGEKEHNKDFLKADKAYFEISKTKPIIFPYLVKPENDIAGIHKTYYWASPQGGNQATFNSNRKGGRKHAGRDLYSKPYTEVVAICGGKVLEISTSFADGTGAVTILHETNDGRKFIVRYGEVENDTVVVKVGDEVKQKDLIGKTGWLRTWYKGVVSGYEVYMLHFEYFSGDAGFDVSSSLSNSSSPFRRRSDLEDGVEILQEGYRNTFEEDAGDRVPPSTLSTSEQGQEFIKDYEKFESNVYNDSEGYCTIGYGYLIAKNRCENITIPQRFQNGISHETALELFHEKLRTFENAVRRDINVNLYQHEFDALVSLLYNTGANFLNVGGRNDGETQIKIKINNGDYPGGANEFSDVTNGGVAGLVTRRTQEINMFKNNVYDSTH